MDSTRLEVKGPVRGTRLVVRRDADGISFYLDDPRTGQLLIYAHHDDRARISADHDNEWSLWVGGARVSLANKADARLIATTFSLRVVLATLMENASDSYGKRRNERDVRFDELPDSSKAEVAHG